MERSRASFNSSNLPTPAPEAETPSSELIGELAHRVLFSGSLDEKLRLQPLRARDNGPIETPASETRFGGGFTPARPENLNFARDSRTRPSLPGLPGLVNDESRGVLLHFFANHELLAAELPRQYHQRHLPVPGLPPVRGAPGGEGSTEGGFLEAEDRAVGPFQPFTRPGHPTG